MFTVKHIYLSGEENVFLTPVANFVPAGAKGQTPTASPLPPPSDSLWIEMKDGRRHELTGGTVFVMNDMGKTVARYDLGPSMVSFHGSALSPAAQIIAA